MPFYGMKAMKAGNCLPIWLPLTHRIVNKAEDVSELWILGLFPNDFPQFHNDSPRHCFQFWSKNSPSHGNGRLNEIWTPASFMKIGSLHSNIFILKVSQSYAELQLFWNAIQLFKVNFNLQLGNNNLYIVCVCVKNVLKYIDIEERKMWFWAWSVSKDLSSVLRILLMMLAQYQQASNRNKIK